MIRLVTPLPYLVHTLMREGTFTYLCTCHLNLILISWYFDLVYFVKKKFTQTICRGKGRHICVNTCDWFLIGISAVIKFIFKNTSFILKSSYVIWYFQEIMEVVVEEEAIEEVKRREPALLPLNLVLKEQENVVFVEWKVSKLLLIMRCR